MTDHPLSSDAAPITAMMTTTATATTHVVPSRLSTAANELRGLKRCVKQSHSDKERAKLRVKAHSLLRRLRIDAMEPSQECVMAILNAACFFGEVCYAADGGGACDERSTAWMNSPQTPSAPFPAASPPLCVSQAVRWLSENVDGLQPKTMALFVNALGLIQPVPRSRPPPRTEVTAPLEGLSTAPLTEAEVLRMLQHLLPRLAQMKDDFVPVELVMIAQGFVRRQRLLREWEPILDRLPSLAEHMRLSEMLTAARVALDVIGLVVQEREEALSSRDHVDRTAWLIAARRVLASMLYSAAPRLEAAGFSADVLSGITVMQRWQSLVRERHGESPFGDGDGGDVTSQRGDPDKAIKSEESAGMCDDVATKAREVGTTNEARTPLQQPPTNVLDLFVAAVDSRLPHVLRYLTFSECAKCLAISLAARENFLLSTLMQPDGVHFVAIRVRLAKLAAGGVAPGDLLLAMNQFLTLASEDVAGRGMDSSAEVVGHGVVAWCGSSVAKGIASGSLAAAHLRALLKLLQQLRGMGLSLPSPVEPLQQARQHLALTLAHHLVAASSSSSSPGPPSTSESVGIRISDYLCLGPELASFSEEAVLQQIDPIFCRLLDVEVRRQRGDSASERSKPTGAVNDVTAVRQCLDVLAMAVALGRLWESSGDPHEEEEEVQRSAAKPLPSGLRSLEAVVHWLAECPTATALQAAIDGGVGGDVAGDNGWSMPSSTTTMTDSTIASEETPPPPTPASAREMLSAAVSAREVVSAIAEAHSQRAVDNAVRGVVMDLLEAAQTSIGRIFS